MAKASKGECKVLKGQTTLTSSKLSTIKIKKIDYRFIFYANLNVICINSSIV